MTKRQYSVNHSPHAIRRSSGFRVSSVSGVTVTAVTHELIRAVRNGLADLADPAKAPEMQRYMKSDMPFRGVPKPARAQLARRLFAEHVITDRATWQDTVRRLWHEATYREERYLAIELTGHRMARAWQDPDTVPLYQELIVTGAWWDFVDELAIRRVGPILRNYRDELTPLMRSWARHDDLWLRRAAVICQVTAKDQTDPDLLADVIAATLHDKDFFLRKGIGWALRDYAKTEPGWVRTFVDAHPDLSPLSRREALKHL